MKKIEPQNIFFIRGIFCGSVSAFVFSIFTSFEKDSDNNIIRIRLNIIEYTKNLSKALDLCVQLADRLLLTRDEISFLEYHDLEQFKLNIIDSIRLKEIVNYKIYERKNNHFTNFKPLSNPGI